ncbi:serine acetyltransferase [Nannochloropsis oceanica]
MVLMMDGLCGILCNGLVYMTLFIWLPLLSSFPSAWRGMRNDFLMLYTDPAFESPVEGLFAYPGLWALWTYRLSHALWERRLPFLSRFVPRLAMSIVRYLTSIDIHPAAKLSDGGLMMDHACGIVIGATAVVGGKTIFYHQVTLGSAGKEVSAGTKRHPTVGAGCVLGAGSKILGGITLGDGVMVGANSVVTKDVPGHTTVVGIPARAVGLNRAVYVDSNAEAIAILHHRLALLEVLLQHGGREGASSPLGTSISQASLSSPPSRSETPTPAFAMLEIPIPKREGEREEGTEGGRTLEPGSSPTTQRHVDAREFCSPSHDARSFSVGGTGVRREGGREGGRGRAAFSDLTPSWEGRSFPSGWDGGREGEREGGQQEQQQNNALEQLHARQLAKDVGVMVDEEGDRRRTRSLQRYWSKISRKQGGFQGLHVILNSLKENEAVDESYVCSGL